MIFGHFKEAGFISFHAVFLVLAFHAGPTSARLTDATVRVGLGMQREGCINQRTDLRLLTHRDLDDVMDVIRHRRQVELDNLLQRRTKFFGALDE